MKIRKQGQTQAQTHTVQYFVNMTFMKLELPVKNVKS